MSSILSHIVPCDIGDHQNEWGTGSESVPQRHLGFFRGKGQEKCRINTIVAVCAARYPAMVLPRNVCLCSLGSRPSKWSLGPFAVLIRTQLPAYFGNDPFSRQWSAAAGPPDTGIQMRGTIVSVGFSKGITAICLHFFPIFVHTCYEEHLTFFYNSFTCCPIYCHRTCNRMIIPFSTVCL